MTTAGRIGREMAVQMLGFGVQIADRILIAGLLIRAWGVAGFAEWSLVLAAGGMVALFDFGVNLYWANRVLFLVQRGETARARAVVRAGNLLMIGASLIGLLAVLIGFGVYVGRNSGIDVTPTLWTAAALLAGASFARIATTIQMSVYRAHEQYAQQSMLWIAADIVRIVVTAGVAIGGGSLLAVAAAQLGAAVLVHGLTLVDNNRRFPDYAVGVGRIPEAERGGLVHLMMGFWLQSAPSTALTYIPIFLLGGVGTAVGLAQFALMRTLSNLMRAVLQPFSVVCGQESARRFTLDDRAGVRSTYRESVVLLGALGAIPAGLLLALGRPFFELWSGNAQLFDPAMLLLAIAPPLLLPSLALAQAYLATINDPWPIAWSRAAQTVLSIAGYAALPIIDPGLRMFAALAAAEVLALGVGLTCAVRKTVDDAGVALVLKTVTIMLAAIAATYIAARAGSLAGDRLLISLLVGGAAGGASGVMALFVFGLGRARQRAIIALVRQRFAGA